MKAFRPLRPRQRPPLLQHPRGRRRRPEVGESLRQRSRSKFPNEEILNGPSRNQCDQIWRRFATLAKFYKSYVIFETFISNWGKY